MAGSTVGEMSVKIGADISSFVSGFAKVQDSFIRFTGQAKEVTARAVEAGNNIANFASKSKSAASSIVDFGSKLGMTVFGLKELGTAAFSAAQVFLAPAAAMEQNSIAFAGLLKDGNKAKAFLNDLQQFAASTPFEFTDLISASRRLLAFGFAADEVRPIMTDLGDTIAGLGGGAAEMDRLVYAFGQINAKGKLAAEDVAQLTDLGIGAWDILAKQMGISTQEVMDLTSKGLIPADKALNMLRAGMKDAFGGQMQAQAGTFSGLMSTASDNIKQAWLSFSGPLFEQAKGALEQIGKFLSSPEFQAGAKKLGEQVGQAFVKIGTAIAPHIPSLIKFGQQLFQIGITVASFLQPPIMWLIGAFQNIYTWVTTTQVGMATFQGVLISAGIIIGTLLVAAFIAWAIAAGSAAIATLAATWPIIAIGAIIAAVVAGIILVVQNWGAIVDWLAGVWRGFSDWFMGLINGIGKWFSDVWGGIGAFFTGLWRGIVDGTMSLVSGFVNSLVSKFNQVRDGVMGAFNFIKDGVGGVFRGIMNTIISWLNNGIGAIQNFINGFLSGINWVAEQLHLPAPVGMVSLPRVPYLASGVDYFAGGLAVVGERGPELVALPQGTRVFPNNETGKMLGKNNWLPSYDRSYSHPISRSQSNSDTSANSRPVNITIQLDKRTLASALLPALLEDIRLATGSRF